MSAALDGIRVVELGQWIAAPYCAALLADLGAEVIKIEKPGGDDQRRSGPPTSDGESAYFSMLNRNKRGVVLDLAHPEDRAKCLALISSADVVIENYRPGVLERYGLDHAALAERCPGLVYCAISGFGQTGPLRSKGGFDLVIQAMSGLASICGAPDGPPQKLPVPLVDVSTGLFAAIGILAALQARNRHGRGQMVDVSLLESALALAPLEIGHLLATGAEPARLGDAARNAAPYQIFRTADGAIALAAASQPLWERMCAVLGRPGLLEDRRFATNQHRMEHVSELVPLIDAVLREKPSAHWLTTFEKAGVPVGPVQSFTEALAMPHVRERQVIRSPQSDECGTFPSMVAPIRLSRTPVRLAHGAPRLGGDVQWNPRPDQEDSDHAE
ncbi:MAG TPA: CoA transferase [Burkholderiaceae bacterium]|nr:CoA transferase [Burkholderiaceae bacterium]